jgi:hypothetical protein
MRSLVLLSMGFALASSGKPIRLRNQTLNPPTPAPTPSANTLAVEPPAAGLVLIQFAAAPSLQQRQQVSRGAWFMLPSYIDVYFPQRVVCS